MWRRDPNYFRLKTYGFLLLVMLIAGDSVVKRYGPIGATWLTLATFATAHAACFLQLSYYLRLQRDHMRQARDFAYIARAIVGAGVVTSLIKMRFPECTLTTESGLTFTRSIVTLMVGGVVYFSVYLLFFEGGFHLKRTRRILGFLKRRQT